MSALALLLVATSLVGLAGIAVVRSGALGESATLTDIAASACAWLLAGSLGAGGVLFLFQPLARALRADRIAIGSLAGICVVVAVFGSRRLAGVLFAWSTHRPIELDRLGFMVRNFLLMSLGFAALGAGAAWASTTLSGNLKLLLLPAFAAAAPFYQVAVLPWLTLLRAPSLREFPEASKETEAWLYALCRSRGLSRVKLRVQPGGMRNAYVVGGLFGYFVVLGEPLLERMTQPEIRAILAHEVAHLLRSDLRRYLGTAVVAGTAYGLSLPYVFRLWQTGSYFLGAALVALLGALLFGAIPGWVSRKAEFGADALAGSLLGEEAPSLASALLVLADIKGFAPSRESLTHPSVESRIRALGLDPA